MIKDIKNKNCSCTEGSTLLHFHDHDKIKTRGIGRIKLLLCHGS